MGTIDYNNQEVYTGEWKNNKRRGMGIYKYQNEMRYEGEWVDDVKEGICCTRYPNAKYMYRGYIKNGVMSGKGGTLAINCMLVIGREIKETGSGSTGSLRVTRFTMASGSMIKNKAKVFLFSVKTRNLRVTGKRI